MPQSAITEIEDIYKFAAGSHFSSVFCPFAPFHALLSFFRLFRSLLCFSFSATLAVRSYVRRAAPFTRPVTLLW